MTTQPTLFDVGRAQLPPRVIAFASGSNEAREIRGFALAGVPVGFSAELIREEGVQELLRSKQPIFADSGAFSEVTIASEGPRVTHPISQAGWLKRLALYLRLAKVHGKQLFVVAPDRVADQRHTLALIARYRPQLHELAANGAHVLVPVQRGELSAAQFYRRAVAVAGINLIPALPMKKAGMSHADVLSFVDEARPSRLHLLGMGYERRTGKVLVRTLLAAHGELMLTLDSNRLRAVTGQRRRLTFAERELRAAAVCGSWGEAEHEALQGAGERLDYTDSIAFPSSWASEDALRSIAAAAFATCEERSAFLDEPDGYLQQDRGCYQVWECPMVAAALDSAWSAWVESRVQAAVRTAATREVFAGCQIAAAS